MRVFISWSGEQSQVAANAVGEFLSLLWSTNVEPFVSTDIEAGSRWQAELEVELERCQFGVICVTKANQFSTWLNFEAGAITKLVSESRCVPLAIDLTPGEIKKPLGMFQAKRADKRGVHALVASINSALGERAADESRLNKQFEAFWPELAASLAEAAAEPAGQASDDGREPNDMLDEVLTTVRGMASMLGRAEAASQAPSHTSWPDPDVQRAIVATAHELLPTSVSNAHCAYSGDSRTLLVVADSRPDKRAELAFVARMQALFPAVGTVDWEVDRAIGREI